MDRLESVDPTRTAIMVGDQRIDYGRLASDVTDSANWLAGQGLQSPQSVGIFLKHPYWSWVAHLAAMRLGLTVATLTSRYAQEVTAAGGLNAWLGENASGPASAAVERTILFSPQSMLPLAQQFEISSPERSKSGIVPRAASQRLMFSSGTTGNPKGVLWNEEMLEKRIELARSSQGLTADSILTSLLGTDTTGGFRYPLAVWRSGGCVLLRSGVAGTDRSGLTLAQLSKANLILTSPVRLQDCLRVFRQTWDGRDTRKMIVAGGRLPSSVRDAALTLACRNISIAYGATETGSIATGDSGLLDRNPGAVGFVVEGASVQIVDANGRQLPAGQTGIVRTRTSYMADRYVQTSTNASSGAFRDGWFYPGDEGILFADGLLAINGRLSETLNLMGVKVSAADLEMKFAQLPSIREICAIMIKVGSADLLVFAAVSDDDAAMRGLWQQIKAQIPPGVPTRLVRVPQLPRNAMGKVARPDLEKHLKKYFASRESDPTAKDSFSRDLDSSKND